MRKVIARIKNKAGKSQDNRLSTKTWLDELVTSEDICKDIDFRVKMTISCKDSEKIPKIKNAGKYTTIGGKQYQIMHNGVLVEKGGYFGDWMATIIKELKGHHEPQEEKLFHEVIKMVPSNATMIELGSYWAYYSIWFNRTVKNATNFCCEPDPKNLKLGKRNAKRNDCRNMHFIQAAAGKDDGKKIWFQPQEGEYPSVNVPIRSIDGLVEEKNIQTVDVLHMDVQGVELSVIEGAEKSIKNGKVRFIFVSTHHYSISEDPITHERCLSMIEKLGGHIIAEHAIHESYSGDGLIVASFFPEDKNVRIDISSNRMSNSLFRAYTQDLEILAKSHGRLRKSVS